MIINEKKSTYSAEASSHSFKDRLSHHLSVGEKKRIAITTVLSMHPIVMHILILQCTHQKAQI